MEVRDIKTTTYWFIFFLIMIILLFVNPGKSILLFTRFIIVLLLAFLSAFFRPKRHRSTIAIVVTILAALVVGEVFGTKVFEFFALAFTFAIGYQASCELFKKKLIPL